MFPKILHLLKKLNNYRFFPSFATIILAAAVFLRLYHIEFGLPYSFHADEPELGELAIKYTYEIRQIINDGEYFKLIPISYVYGMLPTYILTLVTMLFSKLANLANFPFDKTGLYINMRVFQALFSMLIVVSTTLVAYLLSMLHGHRPRLKLFNVLFALYLASMNWKLIVHAHYLNVDVFLAVFLSLAYVVAVYYYFRGPDKKLTVILGLLLGAAAGTKITALLGLPFFMYLYLNKKDITGAAAMLLIAFGTFIATNPFSWAFATDFAFRTFMLSVKENGVVFDSYDPGPFKYIHSLIYLVSFPVLVLYAYGTILQLKKRSDLPLHLFFLGTVLIYFIFYTLGNRRADRWMLPVLPVIFVYSSYGLVNLEKYLNKTVFALVTVFIAVQYLFYPSLLLRQFDRHTPKSQSYLWSAENLPITSKKLVLTKEGLDPLNELDMVTVMNYEVYESEGAQYFLPEDPLMYDYIILSSRPLEYAISDVLAEKYPFYHQNWSDFQRTVQDPEKFELMHQFVLPKPNLIELDDVFIYKKLL